MERTEIFTDGSYLNEAGSGGWAAVIVRTASGRQDGGSNNEMELRALIEAVKMAVGPCTVVSDHENIVRAAQHSKVPEWCKPIWQELYAAMADKDVRFEWRKRHDTLGQRLAHQLAKDAAKGRG